ncbi:Interleukin-1 receptor accessory protein [Heterocephalus glaber]|uniref:Interleukin-1 receptor accessory protein n=1 Tax=Heterocephalus glaber TaxID=10181 RepID=G5BMI4_HETGA|nr:Interleukin-1 receptor accessory protein [Heterocephalus glaber]
MGILWCVLSIYFFGILQSDASERCDDWGLDTMRQIQVFEDEPVRIKCPLFEHSLKFNYSTAHSAGLTLIWYWTRQDRDLEEPINFRLPENRINKEKDVLWFRPTLLNDTGNHTCMLRNTTYCSKVAFPLEVVQKHSCFKSPMKLLVEKLYVEDGIQKITCPNVDGYFPSTVKPNVTWYMDCNLIKNFHNVLPDGMNLSFFIPFTSNNGNYTCVVTYPENGHIFHLTRSVTVKVVGSPKDASPPKIYSPDETILDGKYDIYVSYTRNAEEEFVLLTLCGVLENEFGYKLCIFDRDSMPGGIVTDETLSFIQKSRRLLVVLSPNYVHQETQALLEFKASLENMASWGNINIILVQYKAVKETKVKELKRAKMVLTVIKWKGEKSKYPQGRFWKQLQVALPVKKSPRWASSDKQGLSYSSLKNV